MENQQKCQNLFKNNNDIKVPDLYPQFSTSRMITMEFINGISLSDK